ncbi:hypothetical protein KCTC52924_03058 [Arenibacter antarcticus]|uniref:Lipid-binding SYLF domain-containing protein n=1 Tax=Arenibacter antarcticus TaxID=2040469 RepID=A0ABW5VGZ3_9FLAO|nr:lipid-binding SYLF domain-containing protein [Arenibacter sp. H213]MCM4166138.1 hypothetical protein [Arenibacter sp. H213]
MKTLKSLTTMVIVLVTFGAIAQSKEDQKIINDAKKAKMHIQKMDAGLDLFFSNASGYVIFPNVGEGAFIVGGASGNGAVYQNGSVVGMADLKKLDIGLQAGGQTFTEIIFFETEDALNHFKQGEYEFSAEAKAIALEKGVAAKSNYNDGVVVFVLPKKGLMADLSVGGQKFSYAPINK